MICQESTMNERKDLIKLLCCQQFLHLRCIEELLANKYLDEEAVFDKSNYKCPLCQKILISEEKINTDQKFH